VGWVSTDRLATSVWHDPWPSPGYDVMAGWQDRLRCSLSMLQDHHRNVSMSSAALMLQRQM